MPSRRREGGAEQAPGAVTSSGGMDRGTSLGGMELSQAQGDGARGGGAVTSSAEGWLTSRGCARFFWPACALN